MEKLKDFIGVPINWKAEYSDGTEVNDVFIGVKISDGVLYDSENDRWVDFEYAKENNLIHGAMDELRQQDDD